MKILYITDCWTGLNELLFHGAPYARGMPAFIYPLHALITQGHNVDLYLIDNQDFLPYNIQISWLKPKQIVGSFVWPKKPLKKITAIARLKKDVSGILQETNYDFVYLHGGTAGVLASVVRSRHIPCGQRLYGTFMNRTIERQGTLKTRLLNFVETKAFTLPKDFLLVTDDGSKGDLVVKALNKKAPPYDFYFWKNGVDSMPVLTERQMEAQRDRLGIKNYPFLFYVARISKWKRQDRAIHILKILKDRGYPFQLYLAGQMLESSYEIELRKQVQSYGLENDVIFMGAVDKDTINFMCKTAIVSFSLYDMCNLGNVFYEMLSAGAVIVSCNDGSLDEFIANQENGFLVDSDEEAADQIENIYNYPEKADIIRKRALQTAEKFLPSWQERVDQEVDLIMRCIHK